MKSITSIRKNLNPEKIFVYFKDLSMENVLVMILLSLTILVLTGNILRVIANAKNNYEIFSVEAQGLNELKDKNDDLKKELEYVSSDEYKMLLLRDSSNLAQSNEELYAIRNQSENYDIQTELYNLQDKASFSDWWQMLLNFIFG